jgi:hypothetical protein
LHGAHDAGLGVSQDGGTPAPDVVDVLAPIGTDEARADRARNENRVPAHRAERAHGTIHAAGEKRFGASEELVAGRISHGIEF